MSIEDFLRSFKFEISEVSRVLLNQFKQKLADQGHKNTGKLAASLRFDIDFIAASIVVSFYAEDYALVMDQGIPAARIPYKRGSGAASSKYIEGLINYFKSKGLEERAAKGAAFATANVQKREGLPTRASSIYSNDGSRTGFIKRTLSDNASSLLALMQKGADNTLETIFSDMIAKTQTSFK